LKATNVWIHDGQITLPEAFSDADMSNRVHIVCTNLYIGQNDAGTSQLSGGVDTSKVVVNSNFVVGNGAHRFYAKQGWAAMQKYLAR
jgi:hypothetical protein